MSAYEFKGRAFHRRGPDRDHQLPVDRGNQPTALEINRNATGMINTGTLRRPMARRLQLSGTNGGAFNNAGGTIRALDGSTVRLSGGAVITGGTLSTAGSGVITTRAAAPCRKPPRSMA